MMATRSPMMDLRLAKLLSTMLLGSIVLLASCATTPAPTRAVPRSSAWVRDASSPAITSADPSPDVGDEERERLEFRRPGKRDGLSFDTFHTPGLVLGFGFTYGEIRGDLDGDTAIVDDVNAPTEFVFLPDIEASGGYSLSIGQRWDQYEITFAYGAITYDANFGSVAMDTHVRTYDLDFKQYYRVETRLQPYLLVGFGMSRASIENGATNGAIVQDAGLQSGINVNVGGGVAFFPAPWISAYLQGIYRFGRYEVSKGVNGSGFVEKNINSDAFEVSLGARFNLMREWD